MSGSADGNLYLVKNKSTKEQEIVKMMKADKLEEGVIQKFLEKITKISSQDNAHIVHYHATAAIKGTIVVTMCQYTSNVIAIDTKDTVAEFRTYSLLSSIADGIQSIHKLNIYHGDLKPANILLDAEGNVVVSDYCKNDLLAPSSLPSIAISTYQYMSPEMLKNEDVDIKTDIWSYGCLMYYILSGKNTFNGKSLLDVQLSITSANYPDLESVFSDQLNQLLKKLLLIDKKERLNIEEIISELQRIRDNAQIDPLPVVRYTYEEVNAMSNEEIVTDKVVQNVLTDVILLYQIIHGFNNTLSPKLYKLLINVCLNMEISLADILKNQVHNPIDMIHYKVMKGTSLGTIDCQSMVISNQELKEICELMKYIPNVVVLYLNNNAIGDEGIEYLSNIIIRLYRLRDLNIAANNITYKGMKTFSSSMKFLGDLETLYLYNNNIGNEGMKYLCDNLSYMRHLKCLNVGVNHITSVGMTYLSSSLQFIPNLIELGIGSNPIGNEGIKYLCNNIQFINRLEILRVFDISINEYGLNTLLDKISMLNQLKELELGNNNIGDSDIIAFDKCMKNSSRLLRLTIGGNQLQAKGMKVICDGFMYTKSIDTLWFFGIYI